MPCCLGEASPPHVHPRYVAGIQRMAAVQSTCVTRGAHSRCPWQQTTQSSEVHTQYARGDDADEAAERAHRQRAQRGDGGCERHSQCAPKRQRKQCAQQRAHNGVAAKVWAVWVALAALGMQLVY
eukprot:354126-Chlamydomonas_euryale.AAC.4